ncbi:TadE family type IV pilus minor pilin [Actinomadura parmotrematis]|uniref:Pilus assembly protein TadE n=1 Tax=Actinomadura parmotrematis TaxID=2864039 RepID=A0ABS7FR87_9ACTN|nr:TadE family type IV pilus minor pilin [Actinomadura parmotrematis]MBW8482916.1 hypothetical protein [Actinomadura parmotrematis]
MVTAEVALALPVLVFVTAAALWGIACASTRLTCADVARIGARAAARGEPLPAVRTQAARALPAGAVIGVHRDGELVRIEITVTVHAPGAAALPPIRVHTRVTAATEPGADAAHETPLPEPPP